MEAAMQVKHEHRRMIVRTDAAKRTGDGLRALEDCMRAESLTELIELASGGVKAGTFFFVSGRLSDMAFA